MEEGITNIVALNFASASNPGGGWLQGARAQEEDLARCSGLYNCLKMEPLFYNKNNLCDNHFYTDGIIYSPNVPFFRNDDYHLLEKPFNLSIITAPAPNVSCMNVDDDDDEFYHKLFTTIEYRVEKILQVALAHGHQNIILGAWGCGAFGNDSSMVSLAFMKALKKFNGFKNVCFAVYDNRPEQGIFNTFNKFCNGVY